MPLHSGKGTLDVRKGSTYHSNVPLQDAYLHMAGHDLVYDIVRETLSVPSSRLM